MGNSNNKSCHDITLETNQIVSTNIEKENINRADFLFEEGLKKIKSKNIFGLLIGHNKYEEAIRKFIKAANLYKMHKNYNSAVKCYEILVECYENLKDIDSICESHINIFECLKHFDTKKSIEYIKKIIQLYFDSSNLQKICKWYGILGDINEKEGNIQEAINAYTQMIEYDCDNNVPLSTKLKLANYLTQTKQYEKAINSYNNLLTAYDNNILLKFNIPPICCNIIIIHLCCDDIINSRRCLQKFKNIYVQLDKSPEFVFLEDLINFYEQYNIEQFVICIREFDTQYKLDTLKINLLLEIKTHMEENALL